jgi:hypothetical protein
VIENDGVVFWLCVAARTVSTQVQPAPLGITRMARMAVAVRLAEALSDAPSMRMACINCVGVARLGALRVGLTTF